MPPPVEWSPLSDALASPDSEDGGNERDLTSRRQPFVQDRMSKRWPPSLVRVRAARVAGGAACALFLGLMMAEASVPRAYSELAAVQWVLLLFAPTPRRARSGPSEPRWATRLLMLELSAVYLFAGLGKLVERGWWGGEAVVRVLRSPHYGGVLDRDLEEAAGLGGDDRRTRRGHAQAAAA